MVVRWVTVGTDAVDSFELPTEVVFTLDERYAPIGGGGTTVDYAAALAYQANTPQAIPAAAWTDAVLATKNTAWFVGHDADSITFDPDVNAITVHDRGMYFVHAETSYGDVTPDAVDLTLRVGVGNDVQILGPPLQAHLVQAATPDNQPFVELNEIVFLMDGATLTARIASTAAFNAINTLLRVVRVG